MAEPNIREAVVFGASKVSATAGSAAAVGEDTAAGDNEELVCAAVVPIAGSELSESDVTGAVRSRLGAAHTPELVLILTELPMTSNGKPDRAALRQLL